MEERFTVFHKEKNITFAFNKLPNVDVLYCADPCVLSGRTPLWKRWQ